MSTIIEGDGHLQAQIAKLKAETELIELQNKKLQAELMRGSLEFAKLQNENLRAAQEPEKIKAETRKLNRETFFYPIVAVTGIVGATVALLKLVGLLK